MKKFYFLIAVAIVAAMVVSCRNNKSSKKAQTPEANQEVVDATKAVLSDEVLAGLEELANHFMADNSYIDIQGHFSKGLTKEQKMVKPDWLLDPSKANEMVTKLQKVNALAVFIVDRSFMGIFELPTEDTKAAIAKLAAELNHPFSADDAEKTSISELTARTYQKCKERGELGYFWQFAFACQNELMFAISRNPEAFLNSITEEQYTKFFNRYDDCVKAAAALAPYDKEIAKALDICKGEGNFIDDASFRTLADAKKSFILKKDIFEARRMALLK